MHWTKAGSRNCCLFFLSTPLVPNSQRNLYEGGMPWLGVTAPNLKPVIFVFEWDFNAPQGGWKMGGGYIWAEIDLPQPKFCLLIQWMFIWCIDVFIQIISLVLSSTFCSVRNFLSFFSQGFTLWQPGSFSIVLILRSTLSRFVCFCMICLVFPQKIS